MFRSNPLHQFSKSNYFKIVGRGSGNNMIVLLVILVAAVFTDYNRGKIPNWTILFGIGSGLFHCFICNGISLLPDRVLGMIIPIILLYPVFAIGGLGAGDLKLFAVVGSHLGTKGVLISFCMAFLFGALFSIIKIIRLCNFRERIYYFFSYVADILKSGKWQLYDAAYVQGSSDEFDNEHISANIPSHKIHFALPILLGTVAYIGGVFWIVRF